MCSKIFKLLFVFSLLFSNIPQLLWAKPDLDRTLDYEKYIFDSGVPAEAKGKIIRAVRTHGQVIIVDGVLNESAWSQADEVYDFVQSTPDFGYAPTEQTEVRVLYDNEAVYIGVRAFDSRPDKITGMLTRRDEWSDSDWIIVYIDSRHDQLTSYNFAVNPYGVKVDFYIFNDVHRDESWDAVWDCKTRIDSLGWTAEFKIPYSVLRFSNEKSMVWGFNVTRSIKRKQERDYWVLKPRGVAGFVSRFGHLVGIGNIKPARRFELLPYAVGRVMRTPADPDKNPTGVNRFRGIGSDFKFGISPGVTLDVTINPDFGQVEEDPSVLNLSVFETFFPERRPFFLEGSKIFATPFLLFHSRRIGKKPGTFKVGKGVQEISRPDFTTILTAAKITGRTDNGITFGVLDAVTDQEFAKVDSIVYDEENEQVRYRQKRLIEPYTNYFVARVRKDILRGASYLGGMLTSVNRQGAESDYTGGVDWQLRTYDNVYDVDGHLAYSYTGKEQKSTGYGFLLSAKKISGKFFRPGLNIEIISPDFDINDLGYLRQNNRINISSRIRFLQLDPWWIFRRINQSFLYAHSWNFDGLVTRRYIGIGTSLQFRNYWSLGINISRPLSDYDDLETRGGPVIRDPAGYGASVYINSDDRHPVLLTLGGSLSRGNSGSWSRQFNVSLAIKPTSFIWFSINPRFSRAFSNSQWVKNIDQDGDGIKDHFVFGELYRHVFDIRLRTNITLTRDLSIQFFMQPYVAVGHYSNFKALAEAGTYNFYPYYLDGSNFDFNTKTLKSNAVLRWEYRPGSTLFLVVTQSLRDNAYPGDFELARDMKRTFLGTGKNIFLVKFNYWFNI